MKDNLNLFSPLSFILQKDPKDYVNFPFSLYPGDLSVEQRMLSRERQFKSVSPLSFISQKDLKDSKFSFFCILEIFRWNNGCFRIKDNLNSFLLYRLFHRKISETVNSPFSCIMEIFRSHERQFKSVSPLSFVSQKDLRDYVSSSFSCILEIFRWNNGCFRMKDNLNPFLLYHLLYRDLKDYAILYFKIIGVFT
jgi:hypothetical protein